MRWGSSATHLKRKPRKISFVRTILCRLYFTLNWLISKIYWLLFLYHRNIVLNITKMPLRVPFTPLPPDKLTVRRNIILYYCDLYYPTLDIREELDSSVWCRGRLVHFTLQVPSWPSPCICCDNKSHYPDIPRGCCYGETRLKIQRHNKESNTNFDKENSQCVDQPSSASF